MAKTAEIQNIKGIIIIIVIIIILLLLLESQFLSLLL